MWIDCRGGAMALNASAANAWTKHVCTSLIHLHEDF